jgi:diguanylate cyclase
MIENTYPESVEESGNYLRIALKNISQYKLPYNPISYSMWYEYAIGRNNHLIRDIELFLEKKGPITSKTIIQLYKKHIADEQVLIAEKKAIEFQRILIELSTHLSKSGNEIDARGNNLNTYAIELSQATSLDTITGVSERIVLEAISMVESSKTIKNQLDSTMSEISMLSKELDGIKQIAKIDMLTGLLNRRGFDEAMTDVLENIKTSREPFSAIMLDIDHFKKVNDTFGHLVGDNVLKMLSKLLKDQVKGKDIVARFGGEEFILVLPQTPLEGAFVLAEQIRLSLQKMNLKIKDTGKSIGAITISLGIALYKDGESIEAVIKRADDALYHAKNNGRNQTVTENNFVEEEKI